MAKNNALLAVASFGGTAISINLRSGRVRVAPDDDEETTNEDRNEATAWVLQHLRAIGVKADPLEVRDSIWKR
jgi:hypothetical protein